MSARSWFRALGRKIKKPFVREGKNTKGFFMGASDYIKDKLGIKREK